MYFKQLFYVVLLLSLFVISSCGQSTSQPSPAESEPTGQILLYTSVPQTIIDQVQADFHSKFSHITLEIYREGTSMLVSTLQAEHESGQTKADMVWVADPSTYVFHAWTKK
ncbi:MAG: hypothetical protein B6242_17120 [Anaerolineaceae bacterium 4572_78]|nr:MAG: hypothetical protein B6242_17120 [Anaerolineaceae bacterium 4572_78]